MLLPLEDWLKKRSARPAASTFPTEDNYFDRYIAQKNKFIEIVYPFVMGGLATFESRGKSYRFYTDHGEKHVNAVIKTAGLLLGCENKSSKIDMTPYEIYLLLMAIISHDAGNIEGRENHQLKSYQLLTSGVTATLSDSRTEAAYIHAIAAAHTSKGISRGDNQHKDTISELAATQTQNSIKHRPRAIAAVLRIADELCEDRNRLPKTLMMNSEIIGGSSAPFLRYADSIVSVDIDKSEGKISIHFSISNSDATNKFKFIDNEGNEKEVYIIDEIINRLSKVSVESSYCFRFLRNIFEFPSIVAVVDVVKIGEKHGEPIIKTLNEIRLHDEGYPDSSQAFLNKYARFNGEDVKKEITADQEVMVDA